MNQEEKEKEDLQYRFGGYQLPMIQLDETGPAYYVIDPHPYYFNQPLFWQKAAYRGDQLPLSELIQGVVPIERSGNIVSTADAKGVKYSIIPPMLPLL